MAALSAQANPSAIAAVMTDAHGYHAPLEKSTRKLTPWQKFITFIWDADFYDKTPEERWLVHKLDCTLLTVLTFGWLMKYIDQSNLTNAYVSGMQVDLKITGNQYTYMTTIYNAVYCILQVPSNMVVLKVRPSYWLAGCEIGWTIFTFAQAGAKNYQMMYAFRFFIAFFEAAFQPVSFFLLGSWYTKPELAKRVCIWFVASPAGSAFSSYMQAGIYNGMDGLAGLAGWRWLYIICGIMSAPFAASVFFLVPDFPENTRAWFLTDREKEMGRARAARNGTKPMTGVVNFSTFKEIIKHWRFWVLVPTYLFYAWSVQAYQYFAIYLKDVGYSVAMRNILPGCAFVIEIPTIIIYGMIADRTGSRFLVCVLPLLGNICPTMILAIYPNSDHLRVFAFMFSTTAFITAIFYTWVNEICHGSTEERGFIIAATNTLFYAFNAFLPTIVFLQTDGPRFPKGFATIAGANFAAIICMVIIWFMHNRQLRQEAAQSHVEEASYQQPVEAVDEKEVVSDVTVLGARE